MDDDEKWRPRCQPAHGLVRPVAIDPGGVTGPTRHQARRGLWRQTTYGLHVPVGTDSDVVEQRILEQSMRVGTEGAVTGWAALRMWGAGFFDGLGPDGRTLLPVPLVSRTNVTTTSDSVVSRASLDGHGIWIVQGARCVSVERATLDDILRVGELRAAVAVIDMVCAARITSLARIATYLGRFRRRGSRLVRDALVLASERSLAPTETAMRLVWVLDARWPAPSVNPEVFDLDGSFLARPDLLDPVLGVFGEYDGALHRSRARHRRDVGRLELLRDHGLEGFTLVAGDGADVQLARMVRARRRALARPASDRRWSVTLPDGSVPGEISIDRELDSVDWPRD